MKTIVILLYLILISCANINWQRAKNATALGILSVYNHTYSWLEDANNINFVCKDIIIRYEPDIKACNNAICQQEIEQKLKDICQERLEQIESKIDNALSSCALSVEIWETSLSNGNWKKMIPEQKRQFIMNIIDNIKNLQNLLSSYGIPIPETITIIIKELEKHV